MPKLLGVVTQVKQTNPRDMWVAMQRGGLCNNLKCLLSTMRLADRHGGEVFNSSPDLVKIYPDLAYLRKAEIPQEANTHKDWRLIVFDDDPVAAGFSNSRESQGFNDADVNARNIDHEFHRIPAAMLNIYQAVLGRLAVASNLEKEISEASDKLLSDVNVSVHMRTWMTDHWDDAPNRHRHYFNFAYYEALVEQYGKVFVSADNASYLQKLVDRFGDRVRFYSSPDHLDQSQIAFINLNILSKSDLLIGSSLSTFTEMAWWLGGCKSQVELVPRNKL